MTGWDMLDFYGALSGMDEAARRKRIPELLNLVGLDERARDLRLGKYSKGMLQRVGLAQALMHSPNCWCWTNRATAWIRSAASISATSCRARSNRASPFS